MLAGVASLPPSLIPALQGILHHKKAKLRIHMRQSVYNWRYVTSAWWKCLCSFVIRSCRPGRCWSRRKLSPELKRLTFQMTFLSMDHSVCTTGQLGYIKDVGAEYKWDNLRQAPMMSSTMPTPRLSTSGPKKNWIRWFSSNNFKANIQSALPHKKLQMAAPAPIR